MTSKEAYKFCCRMHRAFKNGRMTEDTYNDMREFFKINYYADEWKASYVVYFRVATWL